MFARTLLVTLSVARFPIRAFQQQSWTRKFLLSTTAAPKQRAPKLYQRKHPKDTFRADRVLSNRTGKTRKECFQLLKEHRVFDSDGNAIHGPSMKIPMRTVLTIDRDEPVPLPPPLLMVYHKPKWVLSVRKDNRNRPCIGRELLPDLHPVGRLDYDTSGLLLFSSSGTLTQALLHPKYGVPKEYIATVAGTIADSEALRRQLAAGVTTGVGVVSATLQHVEHYPVSQVPAVLQAIRDSMPVEGVREVVQRELLEVTELSRVRLVVREGKHRIVRRILANVGHPVISLQRERMGNISLGDIAEGETRELTPEELKWAEKTSRRKIKAPKPQAEDETMSEAEIVEGGTEDEEKQEGLEQAKLTQ